VELARLDEPDFPAIIETIKTDVAISGKILKTTNSALFGLRTRVSSIEGAVPILGSRLVRTLVLSFSLARDQRGRSESDRRWYQQIWRGSVVQASMAEALAMRDPAQDSATWFLAGLLQDIGRLAMLSTLSTAYRSGVLQTDDPRSLVEVERESFGFTHVDVSVELCRRWNLEPSLIDAIATHHKSVKEILASTDETRPGLDAALAVAAQCSDYLEAVVLSANADRRDLDRLLTLLFRFCPDEIVETLSDLDTRVSELAISLSIDIGESSPLDRILEEAQATLADIALQSQMDAILAYREAAAAKKSLRLAQKISEGIRESAFRDPLTGAFNRNLLDVLSEAELSRCQDEGWSLGFLFLDIDGLMQLNETSGRTVGDQALCTVAEILKSSIRNSDFVIRYGGDEFLVVLVDMNERVLLRIAERIRERISEARLAADESVEISSSIGALIYTPTGEDDVAAKDILKETDRAMCKAKRDGGDQIAIARMVGRKSLSSELVAQGNEGNS
jgi:diguanylate cyclase (GGDEF)-like protein